MAGLSQPETVQLPQRAAESPPLRARRVLISLNPKAGSRSCRSRVEAISDAVSRAGYAVQSTTELDELTDLAAAGWQAGELRAVLAIGGDGTASVVRRHVPLGVPMVSVPMGTENLLGRFVGQKDDPFSVCRTLEEGVTISLDLGIANSSYFLMMISAGFDAEVIRMLHENRRGNINRAAYFLPTLRTVRSYAYPELRCECDEPTATGPLCGRWLFGFNLPLYALGLPIAPGAMATDGLLDVCLFQRGSTWSILRYLWHVKRGRIERLTDAVQFRSRRFRICGPIGQSVAYQTDGDYGGTLPVDVDVLPGELRLLVPRQTAERLGFTVNHR